MNFSNFNHNQSERKRSYLSIYLILLVVSTATSNSYSDDKSSNNSKYSIASALSGATTASIAAVAPSTLDAATVDSDDISSVSSSSFAAGLSKFFKKMGIKQNFFQNECEGINKSNLFHGLDIIDDENDKDINPKASIKLSDLLPGEIINGSTTFKIHRRPFLKDGKVMNPSSALLNEIIDNGKIKIDINKKILKSPQYLFAKQLEIYSQVKGDVLRHDYAIFINGAEKFTTKNRRSELPYTGNDDNAQRDATLFNLQMLKDNAAKAKLAVIETSQAQAGDGEDSFIKNNFMSDEKILDTTLLKAMASRTQTFDADLLTLLYDNFKKGASEGVTIRVPTHDVQYLFQDGNLVARKRLILDFIQHDSNFVAYRVGQLNVSRDMLFNLSNGKFSHEEITFEERPVTNSK